MKPIDLDPLAPDLEWLLDAERRAPGLSPAATVRVDVRLDASIAAIGRRPPFWRRRAPLAVTSFVLTAVLLWIANARLNSFEATIAST